LPGNWGARLIIGRRAENGAPSRKWRRRRRNLRLAAAALILAAPEYAKRARRRLQAELAASRADLLPLELLEPGGQFGPSLN